MKTIARYVWAIAVLGAILFISSCATARSHPSGTRHAGPVSEFAVVESSTGRKLSAKEMSQLRDAVTKYLESQGVERKGEYYVRVDFTPEKPDEPGEWVIVKLTNLPGSTYTLIAAYPAIGPDDYYPDGYAYDQRYGFGGFSYGNYEPPIFYPTNYHPRPHPVTPHQRDDNQPGDHRPGDKDNHPRGADPRHDGRRDRNDGTPDHDQRPANTGYSPRSSDSGGGSHDRGHRDYTPRSSDSGGSREHGSRDSAPSSSSERSGGSVSQPPPQTPVAGPVSQTSREGDGNQRDRRQQD